MTIFSGCNLTTKKPPTTIISQTAIFLTNFYRASGIAAVEPFISATAFFAPINGLLPLRGHS